jgi:hypothetical protein
MENTLFLPHKRTCCALVQSSAQTALERETCFLLAGIVTEVQSSPQFLVTIGMNYVIMMLQQIETMIRQTMGQER